MRRFAWGLALLLCAVLLVSANAEAAEEIIGVWKSNHLIPPDEVLFLTGKPEGVTAVEFTRDGKWKYMIDGVYVEDLYIEKMKSMGLAPNARGEISDIFPNLGYRITGNRFELLDLSRNAYPIQGGTMLFEGSYVLLPVIHSTANPLVLQRVGDEAAPEAGREELPEGEPTGSWLDLPSSKWVSYDLIPDIQDRVNIAGTTMGIPFIEFREGHTENAITAYLGVYLTPEEIAVRNAHERPVIKNEFIPGNTFNIRALDGAVTWIRMRFESWVCEPKIYGDKLVIRLSDEGPDIVLTRLDSEPNP